MSDFVESTDAAVIEDTRRWLRRAVIGLNLCPFAKSVDVKDQVHYAVTRNVGFKDLLADLKQELNALAALDATERDTTLFIAPDGLVDFLEFNDFLAQANRLLAKLGYEGIFQIASLHPQYQFADAPQDAITNCTNRSPYPTLHLLREDSIDRAVKAFPHAEAIFETNMRTMERLGPDGWSALDVGASGGRGKLTP
ncbi:MAG: DUF1415 domain-containing protein [Rhodoferax sp.]